MCLTYFLNTKTFYNTIAKFISFRIFCCCDLQKVVRKKQRNNVTTVVFFYETIDKPVKDNDYFRYKIWNMSYLVQEFIILIYAQKINIRINFWLVISGSFAIFTTILNGNYYHWIDQFKDFISERRLDSYSKSFCLTKLAFQGNWRLPNSTHLPSRSTLM